MRKVKSDKVFQTLLELTSDQTSTPLSMVEKIVAFQAEDAKKEGVRKSREVEFSGFGKFVLSPTKVRKRIKNLQTALEHITAKMEHLENEHLNYYKAKFDGVTSQIEFLNTKI